MHFLTGGVVLLGGLVALNKLDIAVALVWVSLGLREDGKSCIFHQVNRST